MPDPYVAGLDAPASPLCPSCDSPSPLVKLLIQRPCDNAWHAGIADDVDADA